MIRSLILLLLLTCQIALAQAPEGYNYDEAKVPPHTLPELGISPGNWEERRRELLGLFEQHVYGHTPDIAATQKVLTSKTEEVFSGRGMRVLTELELAFEGRTQRLQLSSYRPNGEGPWPVFVALNFYGNQTIYPDASVPLANGWVQRNPSLGIPANRATEDSRGARSGRWPVERILQRGYALCTVYYGDLDPDFDDGFRNGVHALLGTDRKASSWGSIAAWSWGLSRIADHLEQQEWVDRLAVLGHSRLGKTALWAGANDARFTLVVSNNSGCGGAALSRRHFGETVKAINDSFPHWFARRFHDYNERENELPIDQHQLLALMAGRNLYVASAAADLWADPEGERLAVEHARPAFRALGGNLGYHRRPGRHNLMGYDWERFMDFADRFWVRR